MKSTLMIVAVVAVVAIGVVGAANRAAADPVPADWQQLEQSMGTTGDHVVGEELCAAPDWRSRRAA